MVDYSFGPAHTRELMIDGLIQGGMDMNNRLSIYEYAYLLEMLPYHINPDGRNCLVIGLGAGLVPMWYEQAGDQDRCRRYRSCCRRCGPPLLRISK